MATKDFLKLTTKKLKALLETASAEDVKTIQSILDRRATIEEATQEATQEATAKRERLTDEEREALAAELKSKVVGHRCKVVPFNTTEWVDGTIVGITEDKKTNKVVLAIMLDDGRRIVKVFGSKLIQILEETDEKITNRVLRKERKQWTPEIMRKEIMEAAVNVGKNVEMTDGAGTPVLMGRIVAVVPDKRSQRVLYKIKAMVTTKDGSSVARIVHKVSDSKDLKIDHEFDGTGAELNSKFCSRREKILLKGQPLTAESKVKMAEEALAKAEEALTKAKALVETRKAALESAKAEYEEYLRAAATGDTAPLD